MRHILYVAIPVAVLIIVMVNAFFGHVILGSTYDRSINKYSIYVHLQPEWNSYPGNILYDVTNIWSAHDTASESDSYLSGMDPDDISPLSHYNKNQLEYQNSKPYVELKHEFSGCEIDWRPTPYRYAADSMRNWIEVVQGVQVTSSNNIDAIYENAAQGDPYVWIFPNVRNTAYDVGMQAELVKQGYVQFIPICTGSFANSTTTYDYSIMINDHDIGFDAYFVRSASDADTYVSGSEFEFYKQPGCHVKNHNSFAGTCRDMRPGSGLLIVMPDRLDLSLTKVRINLHERVLQ